MIFFNWFKRIFLLIFLGKSDCPDDSDESHCRCSDPLNEYDCKSRATDKFYCVWRSKLCSEIHNCSNMNDIQRKVRFLLNCIHLDIFVGGF